MLDLATLSALYQSYPDDAQCPVASFNLGVNQFDFSRNTYLMGVINLSADSWYRESVVLNAEAAVARGLMLKSGGAALVDVGAESTLARAKRTDEATMQTALLPVVRGLSQSGVLVSIETYHASVTRACLAAGAKVINLTGTQATDEIYRMAADYEAGVIICYVAGAHVREVGSFDLLEADPIPPLYDYFAREIEKAARAGLTRLWLDPGLGFYYANLEDSLVRIRHQVKVFLNSFRLRRLGWPLCQALPHAFELFEDEVRSAEPFFAVLAALGQNQLLRTHEIGKVRGVIRTMESIRTPLDLISAASPRPDGSKEKSGWSHG